MDTRSELPKLTYFRLVTWSMARICFCFHHPRSFLYLL